MVRPGGCHTHYHGSLSTHAPIDIDDIIYMLQPAQTSKQGGHRAGRNYRDKTPRDILPNQVRIINVVKGFQ